MRVLSPSVKYDYSYPMGVNCLAVSPCGKEIAAGYEDGVIRIWDIAQTQIKRELVIKSPLISVEYNQESVLLISQRYKPTVCLAV